MKKNGKFGVVKLLCLCAILAVVASVPTLAVAEYKKNKLIENPVVAFEGVINIWNVDTFEGGSQSKSVYLERVATQFSKENRGVYFLVKNLSVEEMTNNFLNGVYPDIISFGYGVGELVKPILENLDGLDCSAVREEILNSGKTKEGLYAVGYLMGGYILSSTEEKLNTAGCSLTTPLVDLVNSAGYENKYGYVASVVVGENKYVNPKNSYEKVSGGLPLTDVKTAESMYDAYADFIGSSGEAIMLGSHRDLFKLSGKIAVGKLSGVKIEVLSGYTNLIQYAGVVKGENEDKVNISKRFVESLVSVQNQAYSVKMGMVNTLKLSFYTEGEFKKLEDALNGAIEVPSCF